MVRLAEKDDRIVAISSAMCDGTGWGHSEKSSPTGFTTSVSPKAPRSISPPDLPKQEQDLWSAFTRLFCSRSFDQVFQEVALQNLPVIFCIDRAGLVGADGPTHHGLMDIGFLRMMPNMVLTAPANDIEMGLALEFALSINKPVVIRYPKDFVPQREFVVPVCDTPFELGKSIIVEKNEQF